MAQSNNNGEVGFCNTDSGPVNHKYCYYYQFILTCRSSTPIWKCKHRMASCIILPTFVKFFAIWSKRSYIMLISDFFCNRKQGLRASTPPCFEMLMWCVCDGQLQKLTREAHTDLQKRCVCVLMVVRYSGEKTGPGWHNNWRKWKYLLKLHAHMNNSTHRAKICDLYAAWGWALSSKRVAILFAYLLHPVWCLSVSFCLCGCIKSLNKYFHGWQKRSILLSLLSLEVWQNKSKTIFLSSFYQKCLIVICCALIHIVQCILVFFQCGFTLCVCVCVYVCVCVCDGGVVSGNSNSGEEIFKSKIFHPRLKCCIIRDLLSSPTNEHHPHKICSP